MSESYDKMDTCGSEKKSETEVSKPVNKNESIISSDK